MLTRTVADFESTLIVRHEISTALGSLKLMIPPLYHLPPPCLPHFST